MSGGIELVFTLPQQEVLTSNQRLHWHSKAARVSALRARAASAVAQLGPHDGPHMARAHCQAWLTFRDNRRRDPLNWAPTIKALVDGSVTGHPAFPRTWVGLLPDDDSIHLDGPDLRDAPPDHSLNVGWIRVHMVWTPLPLPADQEMGR